VSGADDDLEPGELDLDLRLRTQVNNACERRNLARFANGERRTGNELAPTPVLTLLLEFAEEKIQRGVQQDNPAQVARALNDLTVVISDLIRYGHREFEPTLKKLEAGWRRCLVAGRTRLLWEFLRSNDPAELQSIAETLGEIISRGAWPTWESDFDTAVRERCSPAMKAS
jgi:hypothetical protein